ncbi:MAG: DUF2182 domain-containing protein [Sedimenticola sp.]|nr:DUF2182 domain-containing protein [Sedimenticola sp.]
MPGAATTATLRRDRWMILASLAGLVLLSWLYLWIDAQQMASMSVPVGSMEMGSAMAGEESGPWQPGSLLMTFLMWSVMMVGMMLPSAAPAILLYGKLTRKKRRPPLPASWLFSGGYLVVWTLFSLGATLLQAALRSSGILSPMMTSTSVVLSATLLIGAGLYQWLPLKNACLRNCRSPLNLFMMHWRPGGLGALRMGAEHGFYCVGCCWALMLLLFVAGVMNLLWVALIAGFVLLEKLLPRGPILGHLAGIGLLLWGLGLLVSAL